MNAPKDNSSVTSIHGFTVLPIKFCDEKRSTHYLFFKEHSVRAEQRDKPKFRTLFVINVPPFAGEASLNHLFSEFGHIEAINFQSSPSSQYTVPNESKFFNHVPPPLGYKVAYVVYKEISSVQKAVQCPFIPKVIPESCLELCGPKKWCLQYASQFINADELTQEVEAYMKDYDTLQAEKEEKTKKEAVSADDEGWVKVTKHSKVKGNPRTEEHDRHVKTAEKQKRKNEELPNFYAFQVRESKMKHVAKLRQQFKEDKEKVARLKAARKFKPY